MRLRWLGPLVVAVASLSRPVAGQTDPRLVAAVRLAQDGLADSARAVVRSLMTATTPADSIYAAAVATPGRSDKDRERDARDKPAEVLALAGFKQGMRIADVFAGSGYYSEDKFK